MLQVMAISRLVVIKHTPLSRVSIRTFFKIGKLRLSLDTFSTTEITSLILDLKAINFIEVIIIIFLLRRNYCWRFYCDVVLCG
jgi:hypothetical protein